SDAVRAAGRNFERSLESLKAIFADAIDRAQRAKPTGESQPSGGEASDAGAPVTNLNEPSATLGHDPSPSDKGAGKVGGATEGVARGPTPNSGNKPPKYPAECRRKREQGTVLVHVVIESDGRASGVRVARSSGIDLLDKAAVEAVGS